MRKAFKAFVVFAVSLINDSEACILGAKFR